jgi:protein ImuB
MDVRFLHEQLVEAIREAGSMCTAGAALIPIAAQLAASSNGDAANGDAANADASNADASNGSGSASTATRTRHGLTVVRTGSERAFVAAYPLAALEAEDRLLSLLEGVGISTCGELATLPREAIEVRFGAECVAMWRLSRADDDRRLFRPQPPEEPHASIDFIDYSVTDPERLLFTANALLGTLCDALQERGTHARRLLITLPLADGARWQRELRPARATADRVIWLRLLRSMLERLTVTDAVAGMHVEVRASEAASAVQGDLFDSGFATASAVEDAVSRLIEQHEDVVVQPVASEHALVEMRVTYEPATVSSVSMKTSMKTRERRAASAQPADAAGLTLQLLQTARPILVETVRRRDHEVPVRYRDDQWHAVLHAAGPDRLSGGQWDQSYAREYYRAVTTEGTLVWLYRDACKDRWYLHGWWD